ncbi:hypothetical protein GCM10009733_110720 [Nonomuraea maheshkhaliensis]|uniref:Uncharacterized protein n=1 Tax=Nonomuraea maheshkhaliensis TaxID=419590 RepID=A0ABN2I2R8_9ACTN
MPDELGGDNPGRTPRHWRRHQQAGRRLWHAFTKLGISSRVELTRLVLEYEAACHN